VSATIQKGTEVLEMWKIPVKKDGKEMLVIIENTIDTCVPVDVGVYELKVILNVRENRQSYFLVTVSNSLNRRHQQKLLNITMITATSGLSILEHL
jgi:hypothetical protein